MQPFPFFLIQKTVIYDLKSATFTSFFAKLSLQLGLCSCKRQIHHFHRDHIRQGLLSRPHDTPWKTRHIAFQSCIPLYTPSESMQLASMPFMNFDKKQFFLLSQLWKEHYRLYKCIFCHLAGYVMMWDSLEFGKTNMILKSNVFKRHQVILWIRSNLQDI